MTLGVLDKGNNNDQDYFRLSQEKAGEKPRTLFLKAVCVLREREEYA